LPSWKLTEAELDEVIPLLYGSGAAALGWQRVRQTSLGNTALAEVLHQAYRLQSLQSEIHEQKIKKVFRLLRENSIEGLLVKGWAAASLYPDRALRPYGDIDLCVRPRQLKAAEQLLRSEAPECWIDLHEHFLELDERSIDELFQRSRFVDLAGEQLRLLSPEDHLALLSIHLLKHGAWRPLWLCDVGAAIESLPTNFDWDVCLGRNRKRGNWIMCAIGLAGELLKADIEAVPPENRIKELPHWLVENVLRHWESPFAINQPPMSHPVPMWTHLRRPRGLLKGLRERWPDPILATVSVNGEFSSFPRFPYQLANCISRVLHMVLHFPRAEPED
jgi:hypothetical protein